MPPADPNEKVPAVEESKGLLPQLDGVKHWAWARLLSAPGPAPFFWCLERAANGEWAPCHPSRWELPFPAAGVRSGVNKDWLGDAVSMGALSSGLPHTQ